MLALHLAMSATSDRRSSLVRIAIVACQAGFALLFDQYTLAGEQLYHPLDDLMQYRLRRFIARLGQRDKLRLTVGAAPISTVEHQTVQVNIEVGGRSEVLD